MVNIKHFISLVACECCDCVYPFTAHGSCTITGGVTSLRWDVCWLKVLFLIFMPIICFTEIFFEKLLLVAFWMFLYNLGWYLVFASVCRPFPLKSGNIGLYVTDNRMQDFLEIAACLINSIFPDGLLFQFVF